MQAIIDRWPVLREQFGRLMLQETILYQDAQKAGVSLDMPGVGSLWPDVAAVRGAGGLTWPRG
jgi:hypothetical protein